MPTTRAQGKVEKGDTGESGTVDEIKEVANTENKKVDLCVGKSKELEESTEEIKVASNSTTMAETQLSELIKLLTLKIAKEESEKEKINISVENFAKIIPDFNGNNMPVIEWFETFENNASFYGLSEMQKYVHARNKVSGTAKLFLETVNVNNYNELKCQLSNEFSKKYNCNEVHKMLSNKHKLENETFHEYMLQMRKIAALGNVDERSVIRYIVDGLKIKHELKFQLYSAISFRELREKYEIYEHIKDELNNDNKNKNKQFKNSQMKNERCFNCGSVDHKKSECKTPSKCFKCNKYGHISKNCQTENVQKNIQVVSIDKRFKTISFENVKLIGWIDSGSDVSLMKNSVYKKYAAELQLEPSCTRLCGLAGAAVSPIGRIRGILKVDEVETEQLFLIVPDNSIKFEIIIGNDFQEKIVTHRDENGYRFEKKNTDEEQLIYNIEEIDVDYKYKEEVQKLVNEYKTSNIINQCPVKMEIVTNTSVRPFRQYPSRLAPAEEEVLNKQVDE